MVVVEVAVVVVVVIAVLAMTTSNGLGRFRCVQTVSRQNILFRPLIRLLHVGLQKGELLVSVLQSNISSSPSSFNASRRAYPPLTGSILSQGANQGGRALLTSIISCPLVLALALGATLGHSQAVRLSENARRGGRWSGRRRVFSSEQMILLMTVVTTLTMTVT